jgi:hypothetical protein
VLELEVLVGELLAVNCSHGCQRLILDVEGRDTYSTCHRCRRPW